MNYKKQHFISFGNSNFKQSVKRIKLQARNFNEFKTITVYRTNNFYSKDFKHRHKNVLEAERLAGYGIWKYYLINKKIDEIKDGEFIIYCDAGCTINKFGKKRYFEYLDMLNSSDYGVLSFPIKNKVSEKSIDNPTLEKFWTTKEIFNYFNLSVEGDIANSPQLLSGILIIKKNEHIKNLLNEYKNLLNYDNKLITDYYNDKNQAKFFKENRHDQSIWSVLRKVYGSCELPVDESFYYFVKNPKIVDYKVDEKWDYPFWATRIKK
jgi:hypothetical protein